MADFIDLAQAREQEDRERYINRARRSPVRDLPGDRRDEK